MLESGGIRRLVEFRARGVTAATLARMVEAGEAMRLSRGLYQKPDADITAQHSLAEAAKRVPKGVICLVSALHYHEITLQNPRSVWVAIGEHVHKPKVPHLAVRFLHFGDMALAAGVETVVIDGVKVRIFSAAKSVLIASAIAASSVSMWRSKRCVLH